MPKIQIDAPAFALLFLALGFLLGFVVGLYL